MALGCRAVARAATARAQVPPLPTEGPSDAPPTLPLDLRARDRHPLSVTDPAPAPAAVSPPPKSKRARVVLFAVLALAIAATFGGEGLGLITNVAVRDRTLALSPAIAVAAVRSAAATMPRWTPVRDDGLVLTWEARTRLLGFVDDVKVEVFPAGSGTRLRLRSASRVGASDFGTNGRRLDSFLEALDAQLK